MSRMLRAKPREVKTVNVGSDIANSQPIPFHEYSGLRLRLATGSAGDYELWECETEDGTYVRSYIDGSADSNKANIALPASGFVNMPEKMFAAHFVKLVGSADALIVYCPKS